MSNCPACQVEVDDESLASGRCSKCGAPVHRPSQRTMREFQKDETDPDPGDDSPKEESADSQESIDIELTESGVTNPGESTKKGIDPDTIQTMELGGGGIDLGTIDSTSDNSATLDFDSEQTIQFVSSVEESILAESMVSAHWKSNFGGRRSNINATIKQEHTATQSVFTRASVVVKSRRFRQKSEAAPRIVNPADAPDYELLEVIGQGGMGVVYSARQSAVARTVAVKMLKQADSPSTEDRDKFISEAVVTGELDHPNIVPIYDLGTNDAGALFYSMKRVRGTPWNKVLKEKSLDENLNILSRVADAIAFAHANGVLHRDLKPENIMLGDYGEVLVMDWGLARISPDFPNADAVSQSDVMGGTPAYMAPEMATGPVELASVMSDVYLLGAILYEIITGRPPHTGKTVMECLYAAAKNNIVATEQSGELLDIALQAMATRPEDRYQSVQELQDAIRDYQSHSESILLTESAEKHLTRARYRDDYDLFSRALYGFQEALALWKNNSRAQRLLASAKLAYSQTALKRGDFDLGLSLLDADDAAHRDLIKQLEAGKAELGMRVRRLAMLKRTVAALLLAVVGIVSVAFFAVRTQRDEAVVQRNRAVEAEEEALANFEAAEAARQVAETQRQRAETQRQLAETQRQRAETQRQRAEAEQQRAEAEEARAIAAKQAEEYEAYVARIGLAHEKINENAFDRAAELLEQSSEELRNWEWGRLAYLSQLSSNSWSVEGPVEEVAFSPDGQRFICGDGTGKAQVVDLATGDILHTLEHGRYIHTVAYDATGERFATGSGDHTIRIYRAADAELLQTLIGHTDAVLTVRFSADGKRLLSAGYDNLPRLWDLETGEVTQELLGHNWWVWAAEFAPDDQRIVTASQDGKAIVWQRTSDDELESPQYEQLTEFTRHSGPIYAAQFSPDGSLIASAGHDRRVLLWNPDEVQPVDIARRLDNLPDPPAPFRELGTHDGPVRAISFSPDGESLASGGQDNVIRIWNVESGSQTTALRGHASHVRDCAYSPDGRWLLSAGRDQQVKLWQPDHYAESVVLGGPLAEQSGDAVLAARFSSDGQQVATASRDRTAALWDVNSHELLHEFAEGHDFLASSAVFFANGSRLATGAGDGTVRIWDVATGTQITFLQGTGSTAALAASPDGKWIATGGSGNEIQIWEVATGSRVAVIDAHEAQVTALAFSRGGTVLASGDRRGRAALWLHDADEKTWEIKHWLLGHSRSIEALQFTPEDQRLISASGDNTCGQWDVATGKEHTELVLKHPDWVSGMAISADGELALTSCDDGLVRLWSLADAEVLRSFAPPDEEKVTTAVDLSADGRFALATVPADSSVHLWDLQSGEELKPAGEQAWLAFGGRSGQVWAARFTPSGDSLLTIGGNDARLWDREARTLQARFSPHGAVADVDVSPDGRFVVTGSWDRSAKIWNTETGQAILKLEGQHQGYINSVQFSPTGAQVLTASDDGTARLWNANDGSPAEPVFRGHEGRVRQARFSSDGKRIITASHDKTARIWDAATGEQLVELHGHQWAVLCAAFSGDAASGNAARAITGSEDNTAILWDAESGEQLLRLAGHTDSITAVAISPDGTRALTGSQDNTARLWDALTGKEILTLSGHSEELTSVEFSPDGRTVLTSSRDGTVRLWPSVEWAP